MLYDITKVGEEYTKVEESGRKNKERSFANVNRRI